MAPDQPVAATEFAAWMALLGPFEPEPALAVAVSGGADSSALALLARDWARARGGSVLGLIVDHGLRADSAAEAALVASRLADFGIGAEILPLAGLMAGPGLAARARAVRYAALEAACAARGVLHLLLGHHADDQAETVYQRARSGSGAAGLAGMAAVRESQWVRLVRPLLAVGKARLCATCRAYGMGWVEDPSNADPRTGRGRARAALAAAPNLDDAAAGAARQRAEAGLSALLAARVGFSPLGYGWLSPGPIAPAALGAVLRVIGGRDYAPRGAALARLAAAPRPATLGNARLLARSAGGFWIGREVAPPPCPARHGVCWGGFRLEAPDLPPGLWVGAWGRGAAGLPLALARVLPALWRDGAVLAVPGLGGAGLGVGAELGARFAFCPKAPMLGAAWMGVGGA